MSDVLIIGAGTAGLTAGLYAARAGMETIIVDRAMPGGQLGLTDSVENYPGFLSISGPELIAKMEEQALHAGAKIEMDDVIEIIPQPQGTFQVKGAQSVWDSKAVVFAAGAFPRLMGVPGEKEMTGRGVSYCATCDAPFFRDKEVVVIGGGDTALDEGIYLTRFVSKLTIVHRRTEFRAEQVIQDRAFQNPKIHIETPFLPLRVLGESKVEGLEIRHRESGETKVIPCAGVFVFVGYVPSTALVSGLADLDEVGYVKTDDNMQTKVPGLFACGDCRSKLLRQAITACGEGATAAVAAYHYIEGLG